MLLRAEEGQVGIVDILHARRRQHVIALHYKVDQDPCWRRPAGCTVGHAYYVLEVLEIYLILLCLKIE